MALLLKDKKFVALLWTVAVFYVLALYMGTVSDQGLSTRAMRYAGEVVCFFIVLYAHGKAREDRDTNLLTGAFLVILVSDFIFLFVQNDILGVACFCFAHLLFVRRYNEKAFLPCLVVLLAVLAFCAAALFAGINLPYLYILSAVYAALILLATDYGFRAKLPRTNSLMVRWGMILFLMCDINMASTRLMAPNNPFHGTADYIAWVFYLPALLLLALSAYHYERRSRRGRVAL